MSIEFTVKQQLDVIESCIALPQIPFKGDLLELDNPNLVQNLRYHLAHVVCNSNPGMLIDVKFKDVGEVISMLDSADLYYTNWSALALMCLEYLLALPAVVITDADYLGV